MLQTLLHGAVALASFLGAYAQDAQLEMPRLTQSAQRQEFPLEGEESSFKFSFLTDVRACRGNSLSTCTRTATLCWQRRHCAIQRCIALLSHIMIPHRSVGTLAVISR